MLAVVAPLKASVRVPAVGAYTPVGIKVTVADSSNALLSV